MSAPPPRGQIGQYGHRPLQVERLEKVVAETRALPATVQEGLQPTLAALRANDIARVGQLVVVRPTSWR